MEFAIQPHHFFDPNVEVMIHAQSDVINNFVVHDLRITVTNRVVPPGMTGLIGAWQEGFRDEQNTDL